jgi:hypothetical protein
MPYLCAVSNCRMQRSPGLHAYKLPDGKRVNYPAELQGNLSESLRRQVAFVQFTFSIRRINEMPVDSWW